MDVNPLKLAEYKAFVFSDNIVEPEIIGTTPLSKSFLLTLPLKYMFVSTFINDDV